MSEQGQSERLVRLELKYCERCGGLLLRRRGDAVVYCASCARSLSEVPVLGKGRSDRRTVKTERSEEVSSDKRTLRCGAGCGTADEDGCGNPGVEGVPRKEPKSVRIEASQERRQG